MSDHDASRRRLLAGLAAASVGGLAGCQNEASEDAANATTETTTTTTTASTETTATESGPTRPVKTAPTWTTGRKFGLLAAPGDTKDANSDDTNTSENSNDDTNSDDANSDGPSSRVWATLTEGSLTEARFPRVDSIVLRTLDFLVTDGDEYVARTYDTHLTSDDEGLDRSVTAVQDVPRYEGEVRDPDAGWRLGWEAVPDPARDALLVDVSFESDGEFDVYALCEPAIGASAGSDHATVVEDDQGAAVTVRSTGEDSPVFRTTDGEPFDVAMSMTVPTGFDWATVTETETTARTDLLGNGKRPEQTAETSGVLTLAGLLGTETSSISTTVALGFTDEGEMSNALATANHSLDAGFASVRERYTAVWNEYLDPLELPTSVADDPDLASQYRHAVAAIVNADDKTVHGAGIASPSVPWGSGVGNHDPADYGYNFVWPRDLYQAFTAYLAIVDVERATRATNYVFEYQQRDSGYVAQNTYVDGRTRWGGEQLDEIAFPLVMAYQLQARHGHSFDDLDFEYADVAASARYVARNGPSSGQERWEEEGGYSPSTIAAEIAGLAAAAWLADSVGEREDALRFLGTADTWRQQVADWTVTTTGADGHEPPYFVRITAQGDPDAGSSRSLANGGPTLDERAIVDAGFLELVRLGVTPADDDHVESSVDVVDDTIRVETPNGPCFYRYNGDGYGEGGVNGTTPGAPYSIATETRGRLWPLLTGERAEYELRAGTTDGPNAPSRLLRAMADFGNSGRMLPEQVWDRPEPTPYSWTFGEGTGSATPLSWSMAQYVRLAHSIDAGEPVETPQFVRERYVTGGGPPSSPGLDVEEPEPVVHEQPVTLSGETAADEVLVVGPLGSTTLQVAGGSFEVDVELDNGRNAVTLLAVDDADTLLETGVSTARLDIAFVDQSG